MSKLFSITPTRTDAGTYEYTDGHRGVSGYKLVAFIGGGFILAVFIFYLLGNWDVVVNSMMCFFQNMGGMNTHYHIPMRDGSAFGCSKLGTDIGTGNAADGNA